MRDVIATPSNAFIPHTHVDHLALLFTPNNTNALRNIILYPSRSPFPFPSTTALIKGPWIHDSAPTVLDYESRGVGICDNYRIGERVKTHCMRIIPVQRSYT